MSQSRLNNQEFYDYYMKSVMTGLIVGPVSATMTFPVDKVGFVYQTLSKHSSPSFFEAFKIAFRHPFSGYIPGVVSAASKNIIMFPTKSFIEYEIERLNPYGAFNKNIAAFFAGIASVYLNSPIAVIKALRFNNTPINQIMHLNFRDFYRGTHAIAIRDGVQFGVFFPLFAILNEHMQNSVVAGAVAGLIGSFFSNPFGVIAINQRIKGTSMMTEARNLYQEAGISRFYRGFAQTTLFRMTIQGAATGAIIHVADDIYETFMKPKANR